MNLIGFIYRIDFKYQYVNVEDLIPTVQNNTYTVSITNQAITEDRIGFVSFVQFFKAGVTFIAKRTYNNTINGLTDLCGQKVAAISATIQEAALQEIQKLCNKSTITIVSVLTFTELIEVVINGTADLGFQDEPVLLDAVLEFNEQLKLVGDPFFVTPRGIVCNKSQSRFMLCVSQCCQLSDQGRHL